MNIAYQIHGNRSATMIGTKCRIVGMWASVILLFCLHQFQPLPLAARLTVFAFFFVVVWDIGRMIGFHDAIAHWIRDFLDEFAVLK